jgi:tRNA nucleotidyltransferase (CCA-adding enzyme)
MRRYLVGGAVRDRLLGRPIGDRDWVVVGASAEQLQALGYRRVGRDFPVFLHPQTKDEHILACSVRGDLDTAGPQVTLADDLRGRDLSINAMAEDAEGRLIDPFDGQRDLERRRLRHIDAERFADDPLRVLRVARLAAELADYGFEIAPETLDLMRHLAESGALERLVAERLWQEVRRALLSPRPSRFFRELRGVGALQVMFPELERLFGVPQPPKWHPEIDTGLHTLMVLDQATALSPRLDVRFAALTHDLGKGLTDASLWPGHRGHEARSERLIRGLCERWRVPGEVARLARLVALWHGHIHKAEELKDSTVLKVLEGCDAFRRPETLEHLLLACEADYRGRTGFERRDYPQAALFRAWLGAAAEIEARAIAAEAGAGRTAEAIRRTRIESIREARRRAS